MFTGIVQGLAPVLSNVPTPTGARLELDLGLFGRLTPGESVAVDGVCLTVPADGRAAFDLSRETLAKTRLGSRRPGEPVHVERALRYGDPVGGHLMNGHVDGLAVLEAVEPQGEGAVWTVRVPAALADLVAEKGSVALDGVSLTPYGVAGDRFQVALVPHTLAVTRFRSLRPGEELHFEADPLARYVRRALAQGGRP